MRFVHFLFCLFAIAALTLAGCTASGARMSEPAVIITDPALGGSPNTLGTEKVVTMVLQPRVSPTAPTATPLAQAAFTPPSFSDFGLEPTPYTDSFSGLSFRYPFNWQLIDLPLDQKQNSTMYTISLRSLQKTALPKQQEGPVEGMALDVSVWKSQVNSYEEGVAFRLEQLRESESPVNLTSIKGITLPNGRAATRFEMETSSGPAIEVLTYTSKGLILFDGVGDLTLFDTILATLKLE